jgi:hypothetical protein
VSNHKVSVEKDSIAEEDCSTSGVFLQDIQHNPSKIIPKRSF